MEKFVRLKGQFAKQSQKTNFNIRSAIGKQNAGKCVSDVKFAAKKTLVRLGPANGYRLVSPSYLGDQMICGSCKEYLSFKDVLSEKRSGLASLFTIRCAKCLFENNVSTAKTMKTEDGHVVYEPNMRAAVG